MLEALDTVAGYRAAEIAMLRDAVRAVALIPSPGVIIDRTPAGTAITVETGAAQSVQGYPYGSEWPWGLEWSPKDSDLKVDKGHKILRIHNATLEGCDWSLEVTPPDGLTAWDIDIDPKAEALFVGATVDAGVLEAKPITAETKEALDAEKPENGWVLCALEFSKGKLKRDYVHGRLALPIWSWRSPATEGSTSGG